MLNYFNVPKTRLRTRLNITKKRTLIRFRLEIRFQASTYIYAKNGVTFGTYTPGDLFYALHDKGLLNVSVMVTTSKNKDSSYTRRYYRCVYNC